VALRQYGYTVLEARDGEDALRLARSDAQRDIHLLITDVVMPGLSGSDLAAQFATERPAMRVLYTSGYAETITMRAGVEGNVPLLAKPFLPNDLVRLARDRLDAPPHSRPAGVP
jgi:CheY-like chemotaxis protein